MSNCFNALYSLISIVVLPSYYVCSIIVFVSWLFLTVIIRLNEFCLYSL